MCLAVPAEVLALAGETATVSLGGIRKTISVALLDGVAVGDFVLVHVGYALARIDETEARNTLAAIADLREVSP